MRLLGSRHSTSRTGTLININSRNNKRVTKVEPIGSPPIHQRRIFSFTIEVLIKKHFFFLIGGIGMKILDDDLEQFFISFCPIIVVRFIGVI